MRITLALGALLLAGCGAPSRWPQDRSGVGDGSEGPFPAWIFDEWEGARTGAGPAEPTIAAEVGPAAQEGLGELIAWALVNNPGVRAAEARWRAASQRPARERALPEPQLSYRLIVEQAESERDPLGHVIGLSQMFPWFGTLRLAEGVAEAEAQAAGRAYVAAQLGAVAAIKDAFAQHAYVVAAQDVLRAHVGIQEQLEAVVLSVHRTGQAPQRDLLRVQSELERLSKELRDVQEVRTATAARLNAALGRSSGAALPEGVELPASDYEIDEPRLLTLLESASPELARLRRELEARRRGVALAEKSSWPDFMLGIEYGIGTSARMAGMDGGGEDMLALMVSIGLPVRRSSYGAERREALARWAAARRTLADRHNALEARLRTIFFDLREADRRRILYGGSLRVRAEQVLATTTTAYRAGEADFTDLVQAQRELLEFELAHLKALTDRFRHLAAVEEIVGQALAGPGLGADGDQP